MNEVSHDTAGRGQGQGGAAGPAITGQEGHPTPAPRRPWSGGCAGEQSSAGTRGGLAHAGLAKSQSSPGRSCPWSLAGVVWLRWHSTHWPGHWPCDRARPPCLWEQAASGRRSHGPAVQILCKMWIPPGGPQVISLPTPTPQQTSCAQGSVTTDALMHPTHCLQPGAFL